MVRDFVKGALWGGVVAVAGLAVVSQMAPIDREPVLADAPEAALPPTEDVTPPGDDAALEQDIAPYAQTDTLPETAEAPQGLADAGDDTDEPLLRPMTEAEAPPPASVVPDMQDLATTPEAPQGEPAPEAPQAEAASEPAVMPEAEAVAELPLADAGAEPEAAPDAAATSEQVVPEAEPEAALPEAEVATAPEAEVPDEAPAAEALVLPETAPVPESEPVGEALAVAPSGSLAPSAGLGDKTVDGVTTGRLPVISPEAPAEASSAETAVSSAADLPPIARYARSFANPEGKPLFAILLIDPGTPDVQRADLAALPFPVSFVLDPMAPGAAEAAAIYRAAGQEIVMLATGIPKGATAADLEQSFAGLEGALPEAVALIDTPEAIFQDDRGLSAEVVTHLAEQGRGLVTFDRGLNAADQVARREGLAAATIFRSLDDEGEDAPLIRRYLDRAAFKAAQEGAVVVIGTAREATVTAMMEWAVEGRSASVALAPITAVMALE